MVSGNDLRAIPLFAIIVRPFATFLRVRHSRLLVIIPSWFAIMGSGLGEPLTYHAEGADADNLISGFFQRVAEALPPGGMLIFDVIGLDDPSLAGRTWNSGDDWAVLVETTENQLREPWLGT